MSGSLGERFAVRYKWSFYAIDNRKENKPDKRERKFAFDADIGYGRPQYTFQLPFGIDNMNVSADVPDDCTIKTFSERVSDSTLNSSRISRCT